MTAIEVEQLRAEQRYVEMLPIVYRAEDQLSEPASKADGTVWWWSERRSVEIGWCSGPGLGAQVLGRSKTDVLARSL